MNCEKYEQFLEEEKKKIAEQATSLKKEVLRKMFSNEYYSCDNESMNSSDSRILYESKLLLEEIVKLLKEIKEKK
jgi:hypothetical protein